MTDKEYAIRPNKSQLKRDRQVLHALGKQLVEQPESRLAKLPLSESTRAVVLDAKRFTKSALQRQLRRLSSMLEREDTQALEQELQRLLHPDKAQTAKFHRLEHWRERLIEGDDALLTELIDRYPAVDRQALRQLARNAQKERQAGKQPPKYARLLFQALKQLGD